MNRLTRLIINNLHVDFSSKIEKVRKVIQGEVKARHGKFGKTGLNNWSISKSQKGTEPGVRKGKLKHSLLAWHTRCKSSLETTRTLEQVKLGIKVVKLVKILIGWEIIVTGRGPECHLTFARGRLHIAIFIV